MDRADGSVVTDAEELITQQIPKLRRYARALLGDPARADDLVQETLLRALSRQHMWKPGTNMRAWMFTILHNIHVNNQRRRFVRGEFQDPLEDQPEQGTPSTQEHSLEIRDLAKALKTLPEAQRQVLLLVGLEGMDYKQVADVLEVPVGTVMSRLHRGREALRRLLSYERNVRPAERTTKLRMVP
ncbi:MAG TPA: sigma-70 family RNA polymerase sigma factor [Geminicoccaceae bacterium]